jgi:hypothetical protein
VRWVFAGVSAVSPALWYVGWTHPEVYTWALVVIALVLADADRPGLAALAAAFAALQNPPVMALAAFIGARAVVRRGLGGWTAVGAASLGLLPFALHLLLFGTPNLIEAEGAALLPLASGARAFDVLADLNQGLLPYAPLSVVLGPLGLSLALPERRRSAAGLAVVLGAMIAGVTTTANWNAGAAGLMRYAVWLLPLFAWGVAEGVRARPRLAALAAAAVVVQAAVVISGGRTESYRAHSWLANAALIHAPILYSPDPEIFAERQLGYEDGWLPELPIPFISAGGEVTKVLLDPARATWLGEAFDLDPEYPQHFAREAAHRTGLFYIHPPRRMLRAAGLSARTPADLDALVALSPRLRRTDGHVEAIVEITSRTRQWIWTRASVPGEELTLRARVAGAEARATLPRILLPGVTATVTLRLDAPAGATIELAVVSERLGWSAAGTPLSAP